MVKRLRKAGAILIGRTNLPFASFDWQCRGPIYPEGKNPWNTAHTPGGSSGGSAAAVAAGFSTHQPTNRDSGLYRNVKI